MRVLFLVMFLIVVQLMSIKTDAKRLSDWRVRSAPAWNPDPEEEVVTRKPTVKRRFFITPPTLPPSPRNPPIDPNEEFDDKTALDRTRESESSETFPTTETTNLRIVPFKSNRHSILPIPPPIFSSEIDEEESSGEDISQHVQESKEMSKEVLFPASSSRLPPDRKTRRPPEHNHRPTKHRTHSIEQSSEWIPQERTITRIRRPRPQSKKLLPSPVMIFESEESHEDPSSEQVQLIQATPSPVIRIRRPTKDSSRHKHSKKQKQLEPKSSSFEYTRDRPVKLPQPKSMEQKLPPYEPIIVSKPPDPKPIRVTTKKGPIVIEEVEIPDDLMEELIPYNTPVPVIYERMILKKASGQFPPAHQRYLRAYRPTESDEQIGQRLITTTPTPSTYSTNSRRFISKTFSKQQIYRNRKPRSRFIYSTSTTAPDSWPYEKPTTKSSFPKRTTFSPVRVRQFPSGYQRQLTKHSFHGYAT